MPCGPTRAAMLVDMFPGACPRTRRTLRHCATSSWGASGRPSHAPCLSQHLACGGRQPRWARAPGGWPPARPGREAAMSRCVQHRSTQRRLQAASRPLSGQLPHVLGAPGSGGRGRAPACALGAQPYWAQDSCCSALLLPPHASDSPPCRRSCAPLVRCAQPRAALHPRAHHVRDSVGARHPGAHTGAALPPASHEKLHCLSCHGSEADCACCATQMTNRKLKFGTAIVTLVVTGFGIPIWAANRAIRKARG